MTLGPCNKKICSRCARCVWTNPLRACLRKQSTYIGDMEIRFLFRRIRHRTRGDGDTSRGLTLDLVWRTKVLLTRPDSRSALQLRDCGRFYLKVFRSEKWLRSLLPIGEKTPATFVVCETRSCAARFPPPCRFSVRCASSSSLVDSSSNVFVYSFFSSYIFHTNL